MSADSRIISLRVKYYENILQFVNVYAPASVSHSERDFFFQEELLYYVRNNINNVILGGDWNCVLSNRDCESSNIHISDGLRKIIRSIQCKDDWFVKHSAPEYTFVKQNYGSRLDRFYIKQIANCIERVNVTHISFSDHSAVDMTIKLPNLPKIGKYYWKLNIALLEDENIKEQFQLEWDKIRLNLNKYDTVNDWWELYGKVQIRNFFIERGKEKNQQRYGLLQYLEFKLNRLYEKLNRSGQMNYSEVKELKDRINSIKTEILEGVKIRSRIQEQVEGEKVSAYLIGRQSTIKSKKLMTSIKVEDNVHESLNPGTNLKNQDSIEWYVNASI